MDVFYVYQVNNCTFCTFQTDEILSKADAIVAAVGQDEEIVYSKSTSLQVNILGRRTQKHRHITSLSK